MAAPKLIDAQYDGPQRIDRYDLVAEIASGGMATVYLARLSGVGGFRRFVAIKRLHPHLAGEQEFVEMFLDEARLAAGIHHPNVVPILEVGASDRGYYLVMEYVEGDTLARLLARAATSGLRLPAAIGTRVLIDMLLGLHAAHELRDEHGEPTELVHRDVSPQNVLVGIDGVTRITDFGVARAASRLSATRAGQLKGKIAYMAPEQAVGDPSVDRRADVFSSGIVLWEVLAARRLFKAENEAATLSRVISEPIPHICEVNPDIDPGVGEVVMRSLERDRDERYSSCSEFADDLEKAATRVSDLASSREVAAYVTQVIGNEISQQREAVRSWLARSEPSQGRQDVFDMASRVAAQPPPGTVDQSGLVASPLSAPLGEPQIETGGRSKTPLIIAIAALVGFIGVGAAVTFMGRGETVEEHPVSQASPPSTDTAKATAAQTVSTSKAAESAAPAVTATATATAEPSATPTSELPTVGRQTPKWRPRATTEKKIETKPGKESKSEATSQPAGGGSDVDMANPYR